jgi:hypothetical protein
MLLLLRRRRRRRKRRRRRRTYLEVKGPRCSYNPQMKRGFVRKGVGGRAG